jgi:DNA polymerase III subunit gamma/tau
MLAIKYRPKTWDDLVGQSHVSLVLRNMLDKGNMAPSLIFSGSRGTGKTTVARILAAAMNCTGKNKPCGVCESCQMVWNSPDFVELDGASNGSVADMRELRQNAMFAPAGKYRVYVIDECHSLSREAWNALLKLLEEPPPYVQFVFATTEPEKIPVTIVSRSLSFTFRRLSINDITSRLKYVVEQEGLQVQPEAIERIAVAVDGGMRDALMVLEQSLAVEDCVTLDTVNAVLGLADEDFLFDVVKAVSFGDAAKVDSRMTALYARGANLEFFLRDMQQFYSQLLRCQLGFDVEALDVSSVRANLLSSLRTQVSVAEVHRVLEALWQLQDRVVASAGNAHLAFLTGLLLITRDAKSVARVQPVLTVVPTDESAGKVLSADELLLALHF